MEKSIVIAWFDPKLKKIEIEYILEEMELLTQSAGGEVLAVFYQRKKSADKKYLLGKGKVLEIKNIACARRVELIICFNHLSNVQQRNLERFFGIKVVDRTRLILDIFATRAQTLEGKLQVELAQLLYLLPRLTGKGVELSRLGGGIGTRGPGETKLEVDRRRINKRISIITKRLSKVIKNRDIQRKSRKSYPAPIVSLVGYTSAGKSTLFKTLTHENVNVSSMLFSTLDPLLRRVELEEIERGYYFLLSDTVGFIRDMPKELFKSFKATLEEMIQSDIILHLVDIARPDYLIQRNEVLKVLDEMKIPHSRIVTVYNKIDLLNDEAAVELMGLNSPTEHSEESSEDLIINTNDNGFGEKTEVYISAKEGRGVGSLKKIIYSMYFHDYERFKLSFPQKVLSLDSFRKWSILIHKELSKNNVNIEILCSREKMIKFKEKYGGFVK